MPVPTLPSPLLASAAQAGAAGAGTGLLGSAGAAEGVQAALGSGVFDPLYVAFSFALSILATYTLLHLVGSLRAARETASRLWLAGGALTVGAGLWGGFLTGMLALRVPALEVAHQVPLLGVSLLFAVVAAGALLFGSSRGGRSLPPILGWGLLSGAALVGVIGVALRSLHAAATVRFDPGLAASAAAAALVFGVAGTWTGSRVARRAESHGWLRPVGGVVLGLVLAAVQFTALAALTLLPVPEPFVLGTLDVQGTPGVALAVAAAATLVLGVALLASMIERALSRRERAAEESTRLYREAEDARAESEQRARELEETTNVLQALVRSAPLAIVGIDAERRVELWNPAAERMFGWMREEVAGRPLPTVPEEALDEHLRLMEGALGGDSVAHVETRRVTKDGGVVDVALSAAPLTGEGGRIRGSIAMFSDITGRKRAEEERARLLESERRARREAERSTGKREALAEVGQCALAGADPRVLLHEAVRLVADRLGVELVKVLELTADGRSLALRAGVGWDAGLVGSADVPSGTDSQAGYTLLSRGPVVVTDFDREERFHGPDLLVDHGVRSGISVVVEGHDAPWGVLGAHSRQPREFSDDDVAFVQAVANVLAQAIDRARSEEDRARLLEREREARGEAERRAREEAALRQAAEAVTATFTIDEVIRQIAQGALIATDADGAFVERVREDLDQIRVVAVAGEGVPEIGSHGGYSGSFAQRAIQGAEPMVLVDPSVLDDRFPGWSNGHAAPGSALVVPLLDGGQPIGALVLVRRRDRGPFRDDEKQRAQTFGELAGLAFRKVHLLHESERRREELERVTESRARLIRGFSHDLKNPLGAADGYLELLEEGVVPLDGDRGLQTIRQVRRSLKAGLELINDLVALAQAESGQMALSVRPTDVREIARELGEEYRARAESKGLSLELHISRRVPVLRSDPARIRQIVGNLVSNAVKYTDEGGLVIEVRVDGSDEEKAAPCVAVSVRDTGPGIPAEKRSLLFREFSRLGTEKEGIGLGLAISRRIARALGGDIDVEDAPGGGSVFTLVLPSRLPESLDGAVREARDREGGEPPPRSRATRQPIGRSGSTGSV